jgi:hypothetical protein
LVQYVRPRDNCGKPSGSRRNKACAVVSSTQPRPASRAHLAWEVVVFARSSW